MIRKSINICMILIVLLVLTLCTSLQAKIRMMTVSEKCSQSEFILIGKLTKIENQKLDEFRTKQTVNIEVIEVIKGKIDNKTILIDHITSNKSKPAPIKFSLEKLDQKLIFFLNKTESENIYKLFNMYDSPLPADENSVQNVRKILKESNPEKAKIDKTKEIE